MRKYAMMMVLVMVMMTTVAYASVPVTVASKQVFAAVEKIQIIGKEDHALIFETTELQYDYMHNCFLWIDPADDDNIPWEGPVSEVIVNTPYGVLYGQSGQLYLRRLNEVYIISSDQEIVTLNNSTMMGWGVPPLPMSISRYK